MPRKHGINVQKGVIRAARVELILSKEDRSIVREACYFSRDCLNCMWQLWQAYHVLNRTDYAIREYLEADKQTRGKFTIPAMPLTTAWEFSVPKKARRPNGKPKAEPKQSPPSLENDIYHVIQSRYSFLNTRSMGLLRNKWKTNLNQRPASRGVLPGWWAILLNNEACPSFTKPQPVPLDKQNCELFQREDGEYILKFSVSKIPGKNHWLEAKLMLRRRKTLSKRAVIDKIIAGKTPIKGIQLQFDKGKVYALVGHERQIEKHTLDPKRYVELIPGRSFPWFIRYKPSKRLCHTKNGLKKKMKTGMHSFGRSGRQIIHTRSELTAKREDMNRKARKGKGRNKRDADSRVLTKKWDNVCTEFNRQIASKLVKLCIKFKIGTIRYYQPAHYPGLFLSIAGKTPNRKSQSSWQWHEMKKALSNACEHHGIQLETIKMERSAPEE